MPWISVGTGPVEPGSCPGRPKSRMWTGWAGSLRSNTWVMRSTRQPGTPDTRYAMPVLHSHQLLWVSLSPETIVVTSRGRAGLVTSQIWCVFCSGSLPAVARRR